MNCEAVTVMQVLWCVHDAARLQMYFVLEEVTVDFSWYSAPALAPEPLFMDFFIYIYLVYVSKQSMYFANPVIGDMREKVT